MKIIFFQEGVDELFHLPRAANCGYRVHVYP